MNKLFIPLFLAVATFSFSLHAEDWESIKNSSDPRLNSLSNEGKLKALLKSQYNSHSNYYTKIAEKLAEGFVDGYTKYADQGVKEELEGIKRVCARYLNPTPETDSLKKAGKGGMFYYPKYVDDKIAKKVEEIGMTEEYKNFKKDIYNKELTCFYLAEAMAKTFQEFCKNPSETMFLELVGNKKGAERYYVEDKETCMNAIRNAKF